MRSLLKIVLNSGRVKSGHTRAFLSAVRDLRYFPNGVRPCAIYTYGGPTKRRDERTHVTRPHSEIQYQHVPAAPFC